MKQIWLFGIGLVQLQFDINAREKLTIPNATI